MTMTMTMTMMMMMTMIDCNSNSDNQWEEEEGGGIGWWLPQRQLQLQLQHQHEKLGFLCLWTTFLSLLLIFIFHAAKKTKSRAPPPSPPPPPPPPLMSHASPPPPQELAISESELVSQADLKFLIQNLDPDPNVRWEHVICKSNNHLSYTASCFKPKGAPIQYSSVTLFENCSPQILRDFYMDNDYRMQWDKTLLLHDHLQFHPTHGIEIGRTIKKFPLLTPREYVLAWRLWQGSDHSFYCFIKDCEHPLAPRNKKYVRVSFFRSGWRIRKVPGRNACEIKMYHQEDAGLNVEMTKLAFAKGIWSYVCKMDNALRKYNAISCPQMGPAVSLIQKVPPGLEMMNVAGDTPASPAATPIGGIVVDETKEKKFHRMPSMKVLANGLLLLGSVICLSRGRSSLGAKVAMAYILTKLRKRNASPGQSGES